MEITLNKDFWDKRLQAHENRMNPSWYDREQIARPVLAVFKALSILSGAAGITFATTFGASMAIPAAGLILAAVALQIFVAKYRRDDYSEVGAAFVIKQEKLAFESEGNIAAKMKLLECSGSPMKPADFIYSCYGNHIENFDFETLYKFMLHENPGIFDRMTIIKLNMAFIDCNAEYCKKAAIYYNLPGFLDNTLLERLEVNELNKSYLEFIARNGDDGYRYLSLKGQEKYRNLGWDLPKSALPLKNFVESSRHPEDDKNETCSYSGLNFGNQDIGSGFNGDE